jgi:hypothetical protein
VKLRVRINLRTAAHIHAETTRGLGAFTLRIHCRLKACLVNAQVMFAGDVRGEIDGEAKGVIQLEHRRTIDDSARHLTHGRIQQRHPGGQGLGKTHFLLCQYPLRVCATLGQLRISGAHFRFEHPDQLVEEGLAQT